ncbi:MAG: hypothetical protein EB127_13685 [Alphaproteobacteria bacterium]|nr:hypothetical protein [Alphaproteobacteria bacterium]
MKFDELANRINESFVPEMARPKNLAFQKWKEENPGVPTYKFFKQQRELKAGGKPADLPTGSEPEDVKVEPSTSSASSAEILSKDPATERTRIAVADYLAHNPGASVDEVIDAIAIDSNEETPLNLEPAIVKALIDQETPEGSPSAEEEPSFKKDELAAKYDRLRQALYKRRGFKSKVGRKSLAADVPSDEEEDDYSRGPKINMRDEPVDPTEL